MTSTAPYRCPYCGAPAWREPREIEPPIDYCHGDEHGALEEYLEDAGEDPPGEDCDASP
jgi:MoaA/NifB/PqqE/SkfB family radical SAM enzyme